MKVGLLTGGGDCPGLNAVIRAVVQRIANAGGTCVGILEGWRGLVQDMTPPLSTSPRPTASSARAGRSSARRAPTPTRTPRPTSPRSARTSRALGLDALVAIGGDDTLGVAFRLHNDFELPVVGVPKTIDNDLMVTDFTFGFDTAINIVTEAVDRLRTTTESHRRIMVVETMGRHSGWIACFAGIAVAADYILVPEVPIDLPHLVDVLKRRRAGGQELRHRHRLRRGPLPRPRSRHARRRARPVRPSPGSAASATPSPRPSRRRRGFETRCVVLGHLQRGGPPRAYDRVLATRLGLAASHLVLQRRFGTMVALKDRPDRRDRPRRRSAVATRTLDLSLLRRGRRLLLLRSSPRNRAR